jgi:hypothetical protein
VWVAFAIDVEVAILRELGELINPVAVIPVHPEDGRGFRDAIVHCGSDPLQISTGRRDAIVPYGSYPL